jgi:type III restriction enzyme
VITPFFEKPIKDKKATMQTRLLPGVNNARQYGRWTFAEFTDVYAMQKDFCDKVKPGAAP